MNVELLAANVTAHWVQSGVLAAVSLVAMRLLNLHEPRVKLVVLQLTLGTLLLLPALQPRMVPDQIPRASAVTTTIVAAEFAVAAPVVTPEPWTPPIDPARAILLVILIGIGARLLWLGCGATQLSRLSRRSAAAAPPAVAASLEAELGVSPRYIEQTGNRGPWTFGVFRPTVALPAGFDILALDFQRAVICHELMHIRRRDIAKALAEEFAVAVLWFHPWAWLLRARIRVAREQVVDARVVEMLGNPEEYVRCLVDISGHDLAPHLSHAGAGMLRPRELRGRIDAILQDARMSGRHLAAAALALVIAVGATTYVAGAAVPLRSMVDGRSPDIRGSITTRHASQTAEASTPNLELANNSPISIQFKDARLLDILAFLGRTTAVVFAGYDANYDVGPRVTIEATGSLEDLLDKLLTPHGLMYAVTGPRTIVIRRDPKNLLQQAADLVRLQPAHPRTTRRVLNHIYPEYPAAALEKRISGTVAVDISVNPSGDVMTARVAAGPEELRKSALQAIVGLKYAPDDSVTETRVYLSYTVTNGSWGVRIADSEPQGVTGQGNVAIFPASMTGGPDATGAFRIGGVLQPPKKTMDVVPQYPAVAQAAKVQGVVIIEVRIDERGNVSETRVLRSIPLLDAAALDAVKQWKYAPTLMNGVPVPVIMTLTVNFTLRGSEPKPHVRLGITLPDGIAQDETQARQPVLLLVAADDTGLVIAKDKTAFGFHPILRDAAPGAAVRIAIYRMRPTVDQQPVNGPPQLLGTVEVAPGGGVVYSPTEPSFGIEVRSVETR